MPTYGTGGTYYDPRTGQTWTYDTQTGRVISYDPKTGETTTHGTGRWRPNSTMPEPPNREDELINEKRQESGQGSGPGASTPALPPGNGPPPNGASDVGGTLQNWLPVAIAAGLIYFLSTR